MTNIDLNSDLGENSVERPISDDEAMLRIVTSANVSCGFHAGSPEGIRSTLSGAVSNGVSIGAHPSYRDFENFGRTPMEIDSATLQAHVEYQLGALQAMASAVGGRVDYVKPHGALYNAIARDKRRAQDVVNAIRAVDPSLVLLALSGGAVLDTAQQAGLSTASEVFADRAYTPEGMLVARTEPGAVLDDPELIAQRIVRMAQEGVVESTDGTDVAVRADSICVHGDSAGAVAIAESTRAALAAAGVELRPFSGVRS